MAMGTPIAVNVANIFLFMHERKALILFRNEIKYFGRFVDDLNFLVSADCDLVKLKKVLYSDLPGIRLVWSAPSRSCIFLDLSIALCEDSLRFHTYQKPRNAYLYIPFASDHPRSNFRAFIKAELLRYNRTNSHLDDIIAIRKAFWGRLRQRGYPSRFLDLEFAKTPPCILSAIVTRPISRPSFSPLFSFCTNYHPQLLPLQQLLRTSLKARLAFRGSSTIR